MRLTLAVLLTAAALPLAARGQDPLTATLSRPLLAAGQAEKELADYCEARVPRLPETRDRAEWKNRAARLRREALKTAFFRGEAERWRTGRARVEWLDILPGGPGYRICKLRYEALPGLWIPALLYQPDNLRGRVPVAMNVNGHDRTGKAADYKQVRCINQAKRGMLVLNPEWLGMGQLSGPGYNHELINALDLCGTSGVSTHFLALQRGLDVLLSLPNADPDRVAVAGLSGGGWQTIIISALDPRVTLSNPVAGYSSFRTRARYATDLGDSEQTPVDLATVADYAHLTAMRAPRPTLLTYNAKDDCCFQAGHALPPLVEAARPVFRLFGRQDALRTHVNEVPGTHNFLQDNREALYRMLGDHFYRGQEGYSAKEISSDAEVKNSEALSVPLPEGSRDFQGLAMDLARRLPRRPELPRTPASAFRWQDEGRRRLREVLRYRDLPAVSAERVVDAPGGWRLRTGPWTVPAVELRPSGTPRGTAVVFADGGRAAAETAARQRLAAGQRVVVVDPVLLGETNPGRLMYLWALFLSTIGDRPLGIQAAQLAAVARWAGRESGPVTLVGVGRRASVAALAAAGVEPSMVAGVEVHGPPGSLKELLEERVRFSQAPELFCFGLLEQFDIRQLVALNDPRRVQAPAASERYRKETAGLESWALLLGPR